MSSGWGPPPQWARPRIDPSLLRPRRWWYALCAIPLVLGAAGAAVCAVVAVRAFPDEPQPFLAPGATRLALDAGEDQTIYRQTEGASARAVNGRPSCTVRHVGTGRPVVVRSAGTTTLTFGGDEYKSALHFDPPADGVYRVRCRPAPGAAFQPLAVGERPRLVLFGGMIVAALASFFGGGLLGGGVVALVAVLRHRHKGRLEREAAGYG